MKKCIFLLGMCLSAQPVFAEVYHYVNEDGRKIYVDRKSQIPPQYRDDIVVKQSRQVNNKVETAQLPSADGTGDESIESQIDSMRAYMRQLETSVEIKGNSVMVPVKVTVGRRNTTLSLILDTGATSTIIHDDALRGLGVGTSKGGRAQVAGGAMIETRKVTLDRFEVGPYKLQSVSASVIEHEQPGRYDGLLGMDFLRSVKYDIDFERAVVIWERDKYDTARRNLEQLQARLEESQTTSVAKQDEPTQP